ncbi:hypothetical protein ES703_69678 [subsurface metagenome]
MARLVLDVAKLPISTSFNSVPDLEGVFAEDGAGLDEALVRPAGERLGLVIDEQLRATTYRRSVPQIINSQGLEVGFQHTVTNPHIELVTKFRV